MPDEEQGLWVVSDVTATGDYMAVVHAGPDLVVPIADQRAAARYARTVMTAVEYARYDAAVFDQIRALEEADPGASSPSTGPAGMLRAAAQVVNELRGQRPPIDHDGTWPLRFEPIVASQTFEPEISVFHGDDQIAALSTFSASQHAAYVLSVSVTVGLDQLYRDLLHDRLQLVGAVPRRMVTRLQRHRRPEWDLPDAPAAG